MEFPEKEKNKRILYPEGCTSNLKFVNGRKEGKCEVYNSNSTLYAILMYHNDRLYGICEFYDNGNLKEKISYINDIEEGWGCDVENGKEIKWYLYRNGEKSGELIELENGMREERLVKNGEVISICSYNENHEKNGIGYLFNNNHISSVVEFEDNKMKRTIKQFEGKEMSIFDDNGSIVYQGEYLDSMDNDYPREGKGKEYKDGEIVYDGHYHLNDREGNGKSYMNGKLVYDGEWKNNKPNGYGKIFDSEGNILYEGKWKDGVLRKNNTTITYMDDVIQKVWLEDNNNRIPFSHSNKKSKKSCYCWTIVVLILLLVTGGVIGYFMWKNKIESVNVVTSQKEFDKLSKHTQHISFAKESCNENTFTNLDFSRFSNLRSIEVGDNSLMYVKNVKIDGLSKLEKVNIGQNSFTEYRNGHASNSQDNSFVMKNCDSLKSLSIDRYSFSDYNSFTIESKIVVRV